jgi:hypothetical protein
MSQKPMRRIKCTRQIEEVQAFTQTNGAVDIDQARRATARETSESDISFRAN